MKNISVIYLVKDPPIERLVAQVEYMRAVADEFVFVVDDRTDPKKVAIIQSWKDTKVIPFTWIDDFSAARNAALEHVTRPWTLHLDPDELPSYAMMQHLEKVTAPDAAPPEGRPMPVAWVYWFYNWWEGVKGEEMEYHWHIRLWQTGHGRFYRRVHELVALDGRDESQTRGSIAQFAPRDCYVIHSKSEARFVEDDKLYARLGEVSH